jgi:hypothetical protein
LFERRREDRRVRVEHSVRRVLRCVERARPLNNDDDKKKDFFRVLLAMLSTCHQPATR